MSNYMTHWKRKSYGDSKSSMVWRDGDGRGMNRQSTEDFEGSGSTLYIMMVDTFVTHLPKPTGRATPRPNHVNYRFGGIMN